MTRLPRGFSLIVVLITLAVASIVGGTGWYVYSRHFASPTVTSGPKSLATLKVESDPAGIDVVGAPKCDSKTLKKTTPYSCTDSAGFISVLTAPANVTANGQAYSFQTWDGCSESNADKKICKVKVSLGEIRTAKASYSKVVKQPVSTTVTFGCPVASKYIIMGPQTFAPNGAAKIVLYNGAKDYQQPTYVQFWSGNTCKQIALNTPLKATKDSTPNQWNSGFGLAASSFLGQTGYTTIPAGSHAYIAVVDIGQNQLPEAIIRDDGLLMIDQAGLVNKLGIADNVAWKYSQWTAYNTILIHVSWHQQTGSSDTDPADWYYYNVDNNTYTNAAPPPGSF